MANYTQRGSTFFVGKAADSVVHQALPAGTYTVKFSEMMGFFLEEITDFKIPRKIYGDAVKQADRILTTFKRRPAATGVHLDGVKGSGKTLLVKVICTSARLEHGIPTIVINQPYHGDQFNAFIQSIDSDAIIVFDEFEKTYGWEHQSKILTLFDGVYPSRKLFLLTTNNSRECSEYLKNRPGRMYYSLSYDVLEEETIREVLEDMLVDQSQVDTVIKYAQVFTFLNFDMLVAIIEEMNRYNEPLEEVLKMLNVQPEMRRDDAFDVAITVNGQAPFPLRDISGYDPNTWSVWIEASELQMAALPLEARHGDGDNDTTEEIVDRLTSSDPATQNRAILALQNQSAGGGEDLRMGPQDLTGFDPAKGLFTYKTKWRGVDVVLTVERDEADRFGANLFAKGAF